MSPFHKDIFSLFIKRITNRTKNSRTQSIARRLKLPIAKRTAGTIEGVHPSFYKGLGHDFEDFKLYQPGDDAQYIDWKASAKNQQLVVRRFQVDHNTNMTFLIDSGRHLLSRTDSGETKLEVLKMACETFATIAARRMDSVGIIAGDAKRIVNERSRLGVGNALAALSKIDQFVSSESPESDYSRILKYACTSLNQRRFLVLIFSESQFYDKLHEKIILIKRLKERHDVIAISLRSVNPFLTDLPNISGDVIDVSAHRRVSSYFRSDKLAKIVSKEMSKQRTEIRKAFKSVSIPLFCAGGTDELIEKFVRNLQRREIAKLR